MKAREEAEYEIYRLRTTIEYYRALIDGDDISVIKSLKVVRARTKAINPRKKIKTDVWFDRIIFGPENLVGIVHHDKIILHYSWGITKAINNPYGLGQISLRIGANDVPYIGPIYNHEHIYKKRRNLLLYYTRVLYIAAVDIKEIVHIRSSGHIGMVFDGSIIIYSTHRVNRLRYLIANPPEYFDLMPDGETLCYKRNGFIEFLKPTIPTLFATFLGKFRPGPGNSIMCINGCVIKFYRDCTRDVFMEAWEFPYLVDDCLWQHQQKRFFIKHEHIDIYSQDKKYIGRYEHACFPDNTRRFSDEILREYEKNGISSITKMPFGMIVLHYEDKEFIHIIDYNGKLIGWCPEQYYTSDAFILHDRKTLVQCLELPHKLKTLVALIKIEFI